MEKRHPSHDHAPGAENRGYVYREQIGSEAAGRAVIAHLLARGGPATDAGWRARIADGSVRLDGGATTAEATLCAGQWLTWARPPWVEPDVPMHAPVLYRDDDLLAVSKPRGLPSVPAGGVFLEHTLLSVVRQGEPGAVPMHRLGRETSGVVLFALNAPARAGVQAQFRERRVCKTYLALCAGHPVPDNFKIDAPIGEVAYPPTGAIHAAAPVGKPSLSRVRVLERRAGPPPASLVEVGIETGRPHQIRIHLAYAGHPLVGDPLFGPGGVPLAGTRAVPGDPGYLLHALRLELDHPRTGARLAVEAPAPAELNRSVDFREAP